MIEVSQPCVLDERFGHLLRSRKSAFVTTDHDTTMVRQHGAAAIDATGWPGWPGLTSNEPIIETYVADPSQVRATSDNEPYVAAWTPVVAWMNETVRAALTGVGVELVADAYITASLTATAELEGLAHVDDDQFVPDDSVSVVAIIGELAGPRVATAAAPHASLRPMAPLVFDDAFLEDFAEGQVPHCAAPPNELVIFPQFGQVHAGPAAHHVAHISPARQLLVMRAAVALT